MYYKSGLALQDWFSYLFTTTILNDKVLLDGQMLLGSKCYLPKSTYHICSNYIESIAYVCMYVVCMCVCTVYVCTQKLSIQFLLSYVTVCTCWEALLFYTTDTIKKQEVVNVG